MMNDRKTLFPEQVENPHVDSGLTGTDNEAYNTKVFKTLRMLSKLYQTNYGHDAINYARSVTLPNFVSELRV